MTTKKAQAEKTEAEIEAEFAALEAGELEVVEAENVNIPLTEKPRPQLPDGFLAMETCPMDGRAIKVADASFQVILEAVFRTTTEFVKKTSRWEKRQYWVCRNMSGTKLPFEPAAWSPL